MYGIPQRASGGSRLKYPSTAHGNHGIPNKNSYNAICRFPKDIFFKKTSQDFQQKGFI